MLYTLPEWTDHHTRAARPRAGSERACVVAQHPSIPQCILYPAKTLLQGRVYHSSSTPQSKS